MKNAKSCDWLVPRFRFPVFDFSLLRLSIPTHPGRFLPTCLGPLLLLACVLAPTGSALAQGDAGAEAKFVAMLKDATLKGTWAPVQQNRLGNEQGVDTYHIARAEKGANGQWTIVYLIPAQGKTMEFPIPATVKFAGDTAVLILDNSRAAPEKANWSARVMFHDDVYAGHWWETAKPEHGGTITGTVTHAAAKK